MSNNKLKDLDNLKIIFDKTISDSLKAYQAKVNKIVADAKNNINRLTKENESLRKENNSYKAKDILMVEHLNEIRGKPNDMIEALLPTGSKVEEDMGTEYKEDASDFESDEEDIEEEDKDLDDESASKGEEDVEEEDEDLDDESA